MSQLRVTADRPGFHANSLGLSSGSHGERHCFYVMANRRLLSHAPTNVAGSIPFEQNFLIGIWFSNLSQHGRSVIPNVIEAYAAQFLDCLGHLVEVEEAHVRLAPC